MASTFAVTRNHLIFGLCLPLAVLMGYLLAEPYESTSLVILIMVLSVLVVPILMRWYHPLLVFSWNAIIYMQFLPGGMSLWMLMAFMALLFAILNRSVNPENRFLPSPTLTWPLLTLLAVVLATGYFRGGLGVRVLGGSSYGGKAYFSIVAAVVGYFALKSRAIPIHRCRRYVTLFFLPGLTVLVGFLVYLLGRPFEFLFQIFSPEAVLDIARSEDAMYGGVARFGSLTYAALAIFSFFLSKHGIVGIFEFSRPWRMIGIIVSLVLGCYGGFRSVLLLMLVTFAVLFCLERLWQTRIALILLFVSTLGFIFLMGFADRLPQSFQRTLSFLPIRIDPLAEQSARTSSEWRLEMWKVAWPEVPKYLFKGKGYSISPDELYMAQESSLRGFAASWEGAILANDFHNGPLSILIPFGLWGLAAFVWLLVAGVRFLYTTMKEAPPELQKINAFLLALFVAHILMFFFVFGSLHAELYHYTGILGLSVALNASKAERLNAASMQ